eukprot:m.17514 g.17514  ORF g.17514 m.17514 type:complete len:345 (+) comp8150_c0_seq2:145-1179(+)
MLRGNPLRYVFALLKRIEWPIYAVVVAFVLVLLISNRPFPETESIGRGGTTSEVLGLKVLVGMTAGKKCLKRAADMVDKWGKTQFNYMFFVYDESDWSEFERMRGVTVFHDKGLKMYHYKKRVTPKVMEEYDYFFLVDCDCGVDNFDVNEYLSIIHTQGIPMSQPSVSWGELFDRSTDHRVCRNVEGNHHGRWANFIECGPFVAFTKEAWLCLYDFVQGDLGSGWGMDYKWCPYLRDVCRIRPANPGPIHVQTDYGRVCAIIDATIVDHLDEKSAFDSFGNGYQPYGDVIGFEERFPDVASIVNTNCICAGDCGGGNLRRLYNSFVRLTNAIAPWSFLQGECRF